MVDNPPFRGAIGQSGQATLSAFPNDSGPKAWTALVAALNCTSATGDEDAEFACVQVADAHTIRSFVADNSFPYFTPVNDNVTQRATPYLDARKAGEVANVPVIYGSNGQEGLFLAQVYLITNFSTVNEDSVYALIYGMTGDNATAELFLQETLNIQKQYPWLDIFEAGAQLYTEVIYQCVSLLLPLSGSNNDR
jgi:carboxylesterase type B